jgi:hypothetical protein
MDTGTRPTHLIIGFEFEMVLKRELPPPYASLNDYFGLPVLVTNDTQGFYRVIVPREWFCPHLESTVDASTGRCKRCGMGHLSIEGKIPLY